jgi:hypothetical protein
MIKHILYLSTHLQLLQEISISNYFSKYIKFNDVNILLTNIHIIIFVYSIYYAVPLQLRKKFMPELTLL